MEPAACSSVSEDSVVGGGGRRLEGARSGGWGGGWAWVGRSTHASPPPTRGEAHTLRVGARSKKRGNEPTGARASRAVGRLGGRGARSDRAQTGGREGSRAVNCVGWGGCGHTHTGVGRTPPRVRGRRTHSARAAGAHPPVGGCATARAERVG